jgi:hypothetical protein
MKSVLLFSLKVIIILCTFQEAKNQYVKNNKFASL